MRFNLARITRQVKTIERVQDLLAAGAAMLGIVTWGVLLTLLAA